MSETETEAVTKLARQTEAELITVKRGNMVEASILLVPDGIGKQRVESLKPYVDAYLIAPERKKGTARLVDLESFVAHVNRHKDANSALFAHPGTRNKDTGVLVASPHLMAVYDYNEEGPEGGARFGTHCALYAFPLSEEWEAWSAADGQPMNVADFAEFMEDRIVDIANPATAKDSAIVFAEQLGVRHATPNALLNLSQGLSVNVNRSVANATKLQSGETSLKFEEKHTDEFGAPITVPGAFLLSIPVFQNGALYQVAVRLRYRVAGGQIHWTISLWRPERIFDHAFGEACEKAKTDTALPLFKGSPEN